MDEIYIGDLINLSFEVNYPSPIESVELEIKKGDVVLPHACEVKKNLVSALIKGEEEGNYIAWFKCSLGDGSVRSFPMDYFVKSHIPRKLTEGDNSFQQYAMENKDRIGESSPPIDIQEPPIKKAGISTMAPKENIGENGIDNEIEYDNPVDKVKKDYSRHGLGAFSTPNMIPGEMSNQVSSPEKVNGVVETRKRNLLTANKEPFVEKSVHSSLKKSMNSWFVEIDKSTSIENALVSLKKSLIKWNSDISKDILLDKIDVTKSTDKLFKSTAKIIKSQPMGSYTQKKAIDSEIKKIHFK